MIKLLITLFSIFLMIAQTGSGGVGNSSDNVLWLKANAGTSFNGNDISAWSDQSGNSNNAAQGTAADQPLYVASAANGHSSIDYDGTNHFMTVSDANSLDFGTGDFTIVAVIRPDAVATDRQAIVCKTDGGDNGYRFITADNNGDAIKLVRGYQFNEGVESNNAVISNNNWFIVMAVVTGSTGNVQYYVNGAAAGSGTFGNSANTTATNTADLYIGQKSFASSSVVNFNGDIPEVIMYNTAITEAQRIVLENYLGNKYGITVSNDYYAYQASHQFDLAGLGRDGSANTNLTANSTLFNLNFASIGTADSYLVFGHDNADTAWTTNEIYTDVSNNIHKKINREWRSDRNNAATASPDVEFNISQVANHTLNSNMSYQLLIDF